MPYLTAIGLRGRACLINIHIYCFQNPAPAPGKGRIGEEKNTAQATPLRGFLPLMVTSVHSSIWKQVSPAAQCIWIGKREHFQLTRLVSLAVQAGFRLSWSLRKFCPNGMIVSGVRSALSGRLLRKAHVTPRPGPQGSLRAPRHWLEYRCTVWS